MDCDFPLALIDATERMAQLPGDDTPSAVAPQAGGAPTDLDAFLASVERRAFRLAQLGLGNREDALDAVQDAMFGLVRYRNRPATDWPPLFWSILRRQLTDRHRRSAVRRRVMSLFGSPDPERTDPMELLPDPAQDPARAHADALAWDALGRSLRQLPRRQRECFLLRELQGLGVAETALAMGCSQGSVKTHLSRAMSALRDHLEDWR